MLKIAMLAAAALTLTAAGTSAKECVNGGFAASCDAGNCSCEFSPSSATGDGVLDRDADTPEPSEVAQALSPPPSASRPSTLNPLKACPPKFDVVRMKACPPKFDVVRSRRVRV